MEEETKRPNRQREWVHFRLSILAPGTLVGCEPHKTQSTRACERLEIQDWFRAARGSYASLYSAAPAIAPTTHSTSAPSVV